MKKLILCLMTLSTLAFGKVDNVSIDNYEKVTSTAPLVNSAKNYLNKVAQKHHLDGSSVEVMELGRETMVYLPIDYGFTIGCIIDSDSTLIFQADRVYLPDLRKDNEFNKLYKEHIES